MRNVYFFQILFSKFYFFTATFMKSYLEEKGSMEDFVKFTNEKRETLMKKLDEERKMIDGENFP